jgi:bifunctional DNA-binding transcriptional regulator/antitoxin component of YhaV-PrlF toxin-antitoxin module
LPGITYLVSIIVLHFCIGGKIMATVLSKLTVKYQATVPKAVKNKLKLNAYDTIAFEIENDIIRLRKANPINIELLAHLRQLP